MKPLKWLVDSVGTAHRLPSVQPASHTLPTPPKECFTPQAAAVDMLHNINHIEKMAWNRVDLEAVTRFTGIIW